MVLSVVALLTAAAAIGYLAFLASTDLARMNRDLRTLQSDVDGFESSLTASIQRIDGRLQQLDATVNELGKSVTELSALGERIRVLQSTLADREGANARLETVLATTNRTLATTMQDLEAKTTALESSARETELLNEENRELQSKIDVATSTLTILDKDRLIIIEVRKDVPASRSEALAYWERVRGLAAQSDPSLVVLVDTILSRIDPYFDWVEASPGPGATVEEILDWIFSYGSSGAANYDRAVQRFRNEALLTVITHIGLAVDRFQ